MGLGLWPGGLLLWCEVRARSVHPPPLSSSSTRLRPLPTSAAPGDNDASDEGGGSFTFVPELPDDCCPGDKDPGAGIYTVTSVYMGGWLQHFNVRAPGMDELERAAFLLAFGADYMYDEGMMAEGIEVSDGEELFPENVLDRWIHVVSGFVGEGQPVLTAGVPA